MLVCLSVGWLVSPTLQKKTSLYLPSYLPTYLNSYTSVSSDSNDSIGSSYSSGNSDSSDYKPFSPKKFPPKKLLHKKLDGEGPDDIRPSTSLDKEPKIVGWLVTHGGK